MKIRNGFVSNSSSSSFIITNNTENKKEYCECCSRPFNLNIERIQSLLDFNNIDDNESYLFSNDTNELRKILKEDWYYEDDEINKIIDKVKGYTPFLFGSIDIHNQIFKDLIYNNPKEITVLHKLNE